MLSRAAGGLKPRRNRPRHAFAPQSAQDELYLTRSIEIVIMMLDASIKVKFVAYRSLQLVAKQGSISGVTQAKAGFYRYG